MNAHIRRAKDYIAKGEHCYRQAADELSAAHDEGATWAAIAQAMGRSENWVYKIIAWSKDTNGSVSSPFGGEAENEARYERQARGALADPERRRQAMRDLPTSEVEALQRDAHEVVMDRLHARQAERAAAARPTAGDLMGSDPFDPSESWADADIIRVRDKAHALRRQVEKWGLVLGSMDDGQAFEYLQEAERNLAEVRVILQERMADRAREAV